MRSGLAVAAAILLGAAIALALIRLVVWLDERADPRVGAAPEDDDSDRFI